MSSEHKSDSVNLAFLLWKKPVNERPKKPAETACEPKKGEWWPLRSKNRRKIRQKKGFWAVLGLCFVTFKMIENS